HLQWLPDRNRRARIRELRGRVQSGSKRAEEHRKAAEKAARNNGRVGCSAKSAGSPDRKAGGGLRRHKRSEPVQVFQKEVILARRRCHEVNAGSTNVF